MYPRTPYSAPALPMITMPLAIRGELVIAYGRVGSIGRRAPHRRSRLRVERDQPTVQRADIDLAAIQRDAAIDDIAADEEGAGARHRGVIGPANIPVFASMAWTTLQDPVV